LHKITYCSRHGTTLAFPVGKELFIFQFCKELFFFTTYGAFEGKIYSTLFGEVTGKPLVAVTQGVMYFESVYFFGHR